MKTLLILFVIDFAILAISGFIFFFTILIGDSKRAKEDSAYNVIEKVNKAASYVAILCLMFGLGLYIAMRKGM